MIAGAPAGVYLIGDQVAEFLVGGDKGTCQWSLWCRNLRSFATTVTRGSIIGTGCVARWCWSRPVIDPGPMPGFNSSQGLGCFSTLRR